MFVKDKRSALIGVILILLSIYTGTIIGYGKGYMTALENQKDHLVTKYIYVQNVTTVTVPEIKEVIKEVPVQTTCPTIPTTTTIPAFSGIDNKTLAKLLKIIKEDKLKSVGSPQPNPANDTTLDEGNYYINQSITFDRSVVSGVIQGQMIPVDKQEIPYKMSSYFNTETVYNVYIKLWNGTLKDVTDNYTKYRTWNGEAT